MLDCFTYQNTVPALDFLVSQGVTKLWFLGLSHPHEDHYDGLDRVTRYFYDREGIAEFWRYPVLDYKILYPLLLERAKRQLEPFRASQLTSVEKLSSTFEAIRGARLSHKTEVRHCSLFQQMYAHEDTEIWAICPPGNVMQRAEELLVANIHGGQIGEKQLSWDPNEISFALLLKVGSTQLLLGSDVTADVWKEAFQSSVFPELGLTALKVCHHGSKKDNPASLLDELVGGGTRELAVVTRYSSSRLPNPEVIADLEVRFGKVVVLGTRLDPASTVPTNPEPCPTFNVERLDISVTSAGVSFQSKIAVSAISS